MAMNDVKETIREFILATCLPGESPENLRDDTPLLTSGILDSLAALSLVGFLQKQFAVELDVYETSPERFDRIEDIAATVVRKRQPQAQPLGSQVS
jgi:acyl carrier protein